MTWAKISMVAAACCTATAFSGAVRAQSPAPDKSATSPDKVVTSDKKVSDADKRAKAADCTKQANAKKLHGTARAEFRETCKNK